MIVSFYFLSGQYCKALSTEKYRRFINIIIRLNLARYMYKIISLAF